MLTSVILAAAWGLVGVHKSCFHWGPWWYPLPVNCWGSCLGSWPYISQGLDWCLWPLLPLRVMRMARVRSATRVQVGVSGPWCVQFWISCAASQCHGNVWHRATAESQVWVSGPIVARLFADVWCFCYHQRLYRCLTSGTMLLLESHTATGVHAGLSGLHCHLKQW